MPTRPTIGLRSAMETEISLVVGSSLRRVLAALQTADAILSTLGLFPAPWRERTLPLRSSIDSCRHQVEGLLAGVPGSARSEVDVDK